MAGTSWRKTLLKYKPMKNNLLLISAFCLLGFTDLRAGGTPPLSLSGTYAVGNSQPVYKKLTDVAAALNNTGNTVTGNVVFELTGDYDGTTGETFPVTFKQFNSVGGNWTVTIRPRAGVSLRTTGVPPVNNYLITLDGVDNLVLDGRPGGTGNTIGWIIRNASDFLPTIRLVNDAQNNTLTWLQLEGQVSNDVTGVVLLSNTNGPQGNDNNTISYCTIRDRSDITANGPANGIYFASSVTDSVAFNSGTNIVHNNFIGFYKDGASTAAVNIRSGATRVLVTYNSFYQAKPVEVTIPGTSVCPVSVKEPLASGIYISNNFIGGSAPECGGAAYTVHSSGNGYFFFVGAGFFNIAGDNNTISNNVIRNININIEGIPPDDFESFIAFSTWAPVDIIDNTIGDINGHDAINVTVSNGSANNIFIPLIFYSASGGGSITGNKIGGITIGGNHTQATADKLYGIYVYMGSDVTSVVLDISGNVIGSTAMQDNIRAAAAAMPLNFSGIQVDYGGGSTINFKNNTIAGISLGYSGVSANMFISGIAAEASTGTVDGNLIADISSASPKPGNSLNFRGLALSNALSPVISNNIIRGLRLTGTSMAGSGTGHSVISGITLNGYSGNARVYSNKIYDLTSTNQGTPAPTTLQGMDIRGIKTTVFNNLIFLNNGTHTNNCGISGINAASDSVKVYHNTIYISGTSESGNTAPSSALGRSSQSAVLYARNNLLVNDRAGGSGSHYIFDNGMASPASNWTVTTSDYNVLLTGNLDKIGKWGTSDLDAGQWKTTGGDANSAFYAASQIAPFNLFTDTATGDLSIREDAQSYVAGKGTGGTGITTDYAGETRSTTAPSAGAFEYTAIANNTSPVITSYDGNAAVTLQLPENITVVTSVTATDADPGTTLTYSLAGGEDAGKFTVNGSTGVLSFITAPDFEQPGDANGDNIYVIGVQVSDGDSVAMQRFKIKITDANDHAPVITSYGGQAAVTLQMQENQTAVGNVTATDIDKNTTIAYSIVNEEDGALFSVNSATGKLRFVTAPDFEHPSDGNGDNVYMVSVKASDGDSSAIQRFKIKVTDMNDNPPVITSYNGAAVVNMELPENTLQVANVTSSDGDIDAIHVYSLVNEDDAARFKVDQADGRLSFITAPDFEHPADGNGDNIYIVSVRAFDGSLSAVQRFVIKITDVNDNLPTVTMTVKIPENTVEVTPLEGTDEDAGSTVTFTLINKEDGALFWINPANGSLEFRNAPDFEQPADADHDNTYLVSVKMTAGDIITILRFKVKVTDTEEGAARTAGRSNNAPEMQQAAIAQTETEPAPGIKAYPNPVTGKRFTLRMDSVATGRYMLEIYAVSGQLAYRQQLDHTGKSAIYPIQLPASLSSGIYVLKLKGAKPVFTEKIIIE
jgi:hypothetical protein